MEKKIKDALDKIRPSLQMDGGDVAFIAWNEKTGILQVEMQGMCSGCPMAQITLKEGIEKQVIAEVPEVKAVETV